MTTLLPSEIPFAKVTSKAVLPTDLKLRARQQIAQCVTQANKLLGANLPMPTCSFDLRGKTAGKAWHGVFRRSSPSGPTRQEFNHVQINPVLLLENTEDFLAFTVPHEVAYLVTRKLYGRKAASHGKEWKEVMRALGQEPERTHRYDVSNAAVGSKVFRFKCTCEGKRFTLGPRLLKAALTGARYCLRCKARLEFTGEAREAGSWKNLSNEEVQALKKKWLPATRGSKKAPLTAPVNPPRTVQGERAPPSLVLEAQKWATQLGMKLPVSALNSAAGARLFVLNAKAIASLRVVPPTERQLAYAQSISKRRRLTIPADTLADKSALSKWIARHE